MGKKVAFFEKLKSAQAEEIRAKDKVMVELRAENGKLRCESLDMALEHQSEIGDPNAMKIREVVKKRRLDHQGDLQEKDAIIRALEAGKRINPEYSKYIQAMIDVGDLREGFVRKALDIKGLEVEVARQEKERDEYQTSARSLMTRTASW